MFIPSAVGPEANFGKKMVEEKSLISREITQVLAVRIRSISFSFGLFKGSGSGCFLYQAYAVEVNGMVKFIFMGDNNHSI